MRTIYFGYQPPVSQAIATLFRSDFLASVWWNSMSVHRIAKNSYPTSCPGTRCAYPYYPTRFTYESLNSASDTELTWLRPVTDLRQCLNSIRGLKNSQLLIASKRKEGFFSKVEILNYTFAFFFLYNILYRIIR